ncbi:juvenile hormone acid O-methyltransferase-like [Chironomus tepperi]|uniref:juvenile hormone acid O-methyltransferase-like n=1 Tax=Chironomus tepperi TaxID=113505 RepID=UPI00391FB0A2
MNKAPMYAESNSEQLTAASKFFNYFGEFIKSKFENKEVKLLDIGCGDGKILCDVIIKESKLKFCKIIGTDKSVEMIKFAKEKYRNVSASFDIMDVETEIPTNLKDQQFDMITSFYCLHWIKDMKNALQNIYKLLNSNGIFCCIFLQSTKVQDIWDTLAIKYPLYMNDWRKHYTSLWSSENDNSIQKYLEDCNFKIIEFRDLKNERYEFVDLQIYSKMMESVNLNLDLMPENVQTEFLKDQMHELSLTKEGDSYVIPLRLMYFIAEK